MGKRAGRHIAILVAGSLLTLSSTAHADHDLNGCLVGPMDSYNRCYVSGAPALGLAAVAAPILLAGAAVTIAEELDRHGDGELPPGTVLQPNGKPTLSYVPAAPPAATPNASPSARDRRARQKSAAFKFNDTATNVVTAVTAVAVVGAIIGAFASSAKPGGVAKR